MSNTKKITTSKENVAEIDLNKLTYETLLPWIDENIRTVQLGVYTAAVVGVVLAARSVRPFKKFTGPRQIPRSFYKKHVQLCGNVAGIEFNPKPVLVVDHRPLLLSAWRRPGKGLKVNVEGVDTTPNGVSWMQTVLVGRDVKFTLIAAEDDSVSAMVRYEDKDVADRLVRLGFATVSTYRHDLDSDKLYTQYYKSLLKMESKAESKRIGVWSQASVSLLKYIFSKLSLSVNRLKSLLKPKSLKLS